MRHQATAYPSYRTCVDLPHFESLQDRSFQRQYVRHSDDFQANTEDDIFTQATQRQSRRMAPSRLMALPAELRLDIMEYTLPESFALGVGGSYNTSPLAPKVFGGDAVKHATQPPLTQVSRQLRRESLALFYRLNTFILALHYRRARAEVDKWIDSISSNQGICMNLRSVTIKHRFGILDFRGTIDFDFQHFRILGPRLWYNAIPPLTRKEVERIIDEAHGAERSPELIVQILRQLVEKLGIEPPSQTS